MKKSTTSINVAATVEREEKEWQARVTVGMDGFMEQHVESASSPAVAVKRAIDECMDRIRKAGQGVDGGASLQARPSR